MDKYLSYEEIQNKKISEFKKVINYNLPLIYKDIDLLIGLILS